MTSNTHVTQFIADLGLDVDAIDCNQLLGLFMQEMDRGLAGQPSSLAMIPTFISCSHNVPTEEPVIVLDAGGTNLRVCTVVFHDNAPPSIDHFQKHKMPGIDSVLSKSAFYDILVHYLEEVAPLSTKIGFCFSYPSEIAPNRDGKLLYWTKEVQIPELVGEFIGSGLVAALKEAGHGEKEIVILNDTVAALLAGRVKGETYQSEDYVGFILGTGTNTAYVEKNVRITKCHDLDNFGSMIINMESGNFDKAPRGEVDLRLDRATNNPGQQSFEKMISGAYLGPLCLHLLHAAAEDGLFSQEVNALVLSWTELSTIDMDDFVKHVHGAESPFSNPVITEADGETMSDLFTAVVARAALLTAVNIAGPIIKSGSGRSQSHPVCINIDGSTFYKTDNVPSLVYGHLDRILGCRGIHYIPVHTDNAPVLGAAIAALS